MAVLAAISFSFASCDDDDKGEGVYNPDVLVKPTEISIIDNDGDLDKKVSFEYDGTDTTRISSYRVDEYDVYFGEARKLRKNKRSTKLANTNQYQYSTSNDIVYDSQGRIEKLRTNNVNSHNTIEYTYEYGLNPIPKASGLHYMYITKKRDGRVEAIYRVDSEGRLISETYDPESDFREITEYSYSNGNIVKAVRNYKDLLEYVSTISYNKNNGVFRNISTPQWFLVAELDEFVGGQTKNNASKYGLKYYEYEEGEKPVVTEATTTLKYLSFVKNFPAKYEVQYTDNEEKKAVYKETYQVKYNFAK